MAVTTREARRLSFAAGEPWWRDVRVLGELLARDAEEAQRRQGARECVTQLEVQGNS